MKISENFYLLLAFCLGLPYSYCQESPEDTAYELYLTQVAATEAFLQLNKISTAKAYLNKCDEQYRDVEWHFLSAFLNQSKDSYSKNNTVHFTDIKLSPDGKTLAASGSDSLITLYSYPEMKQIGELTGHNGKVVTLDFSPDGKYLVSGGRDHAVIAWNLESNHLLWKNDTSFSKGIYQVRFSPDGAQIGVVSWELRSTTPRIMGFATILERANGKTLQKIDTEPHPAAGIVFSNDGKQIIISTWGEITYCYDVASGDTIWQYDLSDAEEYNAFHSIAQSPDGQMIILGSADHSVHVLNANSGELLHKIEPWQGHSKTIKAVAYSTDGKYFASAGEDYSILIWDATTFEQKHQLIGHQKTVLGLEWTDDATLISTSLDGSMKTWDIARPFEKSYEICDYGPWQMPISPDGNYFAAPCSDKKLAVYHIKTGKQEMLFENQSGLCGDYSANGKYLATASFDGLIRVWDIKNQKAFKTLEGHSARVDGIAYFNQKNYLLSGGDTTLRIWSIETEKEIKIIPYSTRPLRIALSPDEQFAYLGFSKGLVRALRTSDWTEVHQFGTEKGLNEFSISPNGKYLAIIRGDGTIEVWNTQTQQMDFELSGHERTGYGIGFSQDSRYVISGSYDQTFKLWNLETGKCTLTFHGYEETIYSTQFVGANSLLIGSSQGKIHYYEY